MVAIAVPLFSGCILQSLCFQTEFQLVNQFASLVSVHDRS